MTPRDTDQLTVAEFDALCGWLDDYQKQMKEAARG